MRLLLAIVLAFFWFDVQAERPPNIIHIMADDLGYGEIGAYGQKLIRTPNLDALAAEGLRFTQYYAGSSLCSPSRWSYFSGLHAGSTGVTMNAYNILPADLPIIPELLRKAGYRTGFFGKWALGTYNSTGYPVRKGFDEYFGYRDQGSAHNYYPENLYHNYSAVPLPGNVSSGKRFISSKRETYAPDEIVKRARSFIAIAVSKPFLLELHLNLPHVNNELLAETGNGAEHPGAGRYHEKPWSQANRGYAEMVSLIDDYVGEIVAELIRHKVAKDTLIVFSSDNGASNVRGDASRMLFNSGGGLRGYKGQVYEGGIRVPMIMWWPGTIKPAVIGQPVAAWDFLPTFAELAGISVPGEVDGLSLASLMREGKPLPKREYLYWEVGDRIAVRRDNWKLVSDVVGDKRTYELYDLASDPAESNNVAPRQDSVVSDLLKILQRESPLLNGRLWKNIE